MKQNFDFITYLDADNWYAVNHIRDMVDLQRSTSAQVCIARRSMHRIDGSPLARTEPFNQSPFFDTSCIFLTRVAFPVALVWAMLPVEVAIIDDRIVSLAIHRHRFRIAHSSEPTVHYRTAWAEDYMRAGEKPPVGAKSSAPIGSGVSFWNGMTEVEKRAVLGFPIPQDMQSEPIQ